VTTYRLMDGASGRPGTGSSGTQPPSSSTSYSGNYLAGLGFYVTSFTWLQGFWWYVADSSQTHASGQKFCLWQAHDGTDEGALIAGTTVTAGALSTGWNYIPYATPVALAPNIAYHAQTGLTNNFPATKNQFGTGDPYSAGIANGPLNAYSSGSGSAKDPWSNAQMPYSVATADPTAAFASINDADDNLWLDVQVTDTAPSGATYRAWPNMPYPSGASAQSVSYTLGMEFSLTEACTLEKIWHYSPPSATLLPSRCGIWDVTSQTEVSGTDNSSPAWLLPGGGAASAGTGWVYCDYSTVGVTLNASQNYKVSTFANAGSSVWFAALANYWTASGEGLGGFSNGPLSIPDSAHATSPGQNTWHTGTTWTYPATSTNPESDWIDVEVKPSGTAHTATAALTVTPAFSAARTRGRYRTASLTVTPSFSAARTRGRYRTAALTVTPAFSAARTAARYRTAALTVTPSFAVTWTGGAAPVAVTFTYGEPFFEWAYGTPYLG
jgi:Domain of unknown function (DUF4082)